MSEIPILLNVFIRDTYISEIISSLHNQGQKKIYISVDGPRNKDDVILIKRLLNKLNKKLKQTSMVGIYKINKKNLGTEASITNAIDWFFKFEERGLILEDDTIPLKGSLFFFKSQLEKYENNINISSISGVNLSKSRYPNNLKNKTLLSPIMHCWGWATWRADWKKSKEIIKNISRKEIIFSTKKGRHFKTDLAIFFRLLILKILRGELKSWSHKFNLSAVILNNYSIVPIKSKIRYKGYDKFATNTIQKIKNIDNQKIYIYNPKETYDYEKYVYLNHFTNSKKNRLFIKIKGFLQNLL